MQGIARFCIGLMSVGVASLGASGFFVSDNVLSTGNTNRVAEDGVDTQVAVPTSTPVEVVAFPEVIFISPADGSQEVTLGIEDPITVRFNHSTRDFFVDFRFEPPVALMYENNVEKTEFRLMPKEPLSLATDYEMRVFIKRRGLDDTAYRELASSRFKTMQTVLTPVQQTVAKKLADAKRDTVAQITQGRYIDISLSRQIMVLFEDGQPLDAYPISSGKRGMDTPKGRFTIENKSRRAWSKTYGLFMPYWMAITPNGKFGIHELPEWPGGYKEGANHLGTPVSHGCVRLGVGSAQRVWDFAESGTPVVIW